MNMLEVHADALQSSNTSYHEFLLYYRNDTQLVYGFVEGKDDPVFYKGLIEHFLEDGWSVKLIVAGDRRRVIETLGYLDWTRFPQKRVCFFVDRDLSDHVGDAFPDAPNLYITDGYSIENSIVNSQTLVRTLEEVLGVQGTTPEEMERIHSCFEENFAAFNEALMPIMAQALLWRRANLAPCLGNLRLKEWFRFDEGQLVVREGYATSAARLARAAQLCELQSANDEELSTATAELLSKRSAASVVRGKYVLWFFVHFVQGLRDCIERYCAKHQGKPPRSRLAFGVENAIVVLASRVRAPQSLRNFVSANFVSYVQGLPG